jgi:AcrR family transcriptional regulator
LGVQIDGTMKRPRDPDDGALHPSVKRGESGVDKRSPPTRDTTAGARVRNPQGSGARLREELIAAAGRLLAEGADPGDLSLRAVARAAGIAAPSVYLQFESKEALLRAVVDAHFATFQQAIERGAATGSDPASRLLAGCLAYCRYAAEHPGSYRVIFEMPWSPVRGRPGEPLPGADAFQVLVDGVAACIAAGVARAGDPYQVATDIWPALHGMVSLRRQLPDFPWPPLDEQVRRVVGGLAGLPTPPLASGTL